MLLWLSISRVLWNNSKKEMNICVKRHAAIDFCIHLGKNQQDLYTLTTEAYKEECLAKRTVQYQYKLSSKWSPRDGHKAILQKWAE